MFVRIVAALALAAAAAPSWAADKAAVRGETKLAQYLAGRTPGKPQSCISQRQNRSSTVFDGTAIAYDNYGTYYLNRPDGASSLGDDDILVTRTFTDQLCRGDVVRLIDRGSRIEHGFVILGDFVPYPRPPKK